MMIRREKRALSLNLNLCPPMFNNKITAMEIEFETQQVDEQVVAMGRLKSGCSCWNNAYFNG